MMTYRPVSLFNRLTLVGRRPRFFSKYEWWYHLLLMPILFPVGNYYFIGQGYLSNPFLFGVGTVLVFGLYWLSIITLTITVRKIIQRFPTARQTLIRSLVMLISVGLLIVGLAVFDVWVYSLVPATGVRLSWAAIRPIWVLGLLFDVCLCMALNLGYTYTQWSRGLREDEQMQRELIQRQYDTLKGQLNPHFLFNSLNALSVLISEEPKRAEEFVDKLAFVYRYMLQPGRRVDPFSIQGPGEVVTLQAELDFMNAYVDLLNTRYGQSLKIKRPIVNNNVFLTYGLPPLSTQTLIDNAIRHNGMSAGKPLVIAIDITDDGWLLVANNRHKKTIHFATRNTGLGGLAAQYRFLSEKAIMVDATETHFEVAIPLLFTRSPQTD